ncbi:E3 ubiquitin-protein ligase trim-21-like [Clytia hemisphaerica]|uniref:E3 ubiquitin-protein ligase trim-21-like n=1 Tax=Clytia hemisphaerica TaxID=252671 RepID=UPI0034D6435E
MAGVEVGQELECCVCLDQFVKPKLLNCMHTLCEGCIDKLIQSGTVKCPECREETKVPNGAAELSTNYIAQNIIEKNVSKKISSSKRYCPKHNELLKYFCQQWKVVVCNNCCLISAQHKNHDITLVSEAIDKAKEELNQKLKKMRESELTMVECLGKVKEFHQKVAAEEESNGNMIKQAFDEIRVVLAKKEEELVKQLATIRADKKEKLKFDRFSTAISKVSQSVQYVESILNENCDDLDIICDLTKQLDEVCKEYSLNGTFIVSSTPLPLYLQLKGKSTKPPLLILKIAAEEESNGMIKQAFDEIRVVLAEKEEELVKQLATIRADKKEKLKFDRFSTATSKVSQSVQYVESILNENCDDLDIICDLTKELDEICKQYSLNAF